MQFLIEYGLFLAKAITIVAALLIVAGGLAALGRRHKNSGGEHLEVIDLNKQYQEMEETLSSALLSPRQFKQQLKQKRKQAKRSDKAKAGAEKKAAQQVAQQADGDAKRERRIYVIDFDGDLRASAVTSLRQEVSAVLTLAGGDDEVVVRLESGGGVVHGYGLAASQLQRIRERNITLTVAVDKIAASGGYMMACVADTIIAAPFAFIGSIGVVVQIPNLHRLLKKHEIDFDQLYAGEYKRTLTLFGKNTDEARKKVQQELHETHDLFKDHVKTQRPTLDIEKVATGEYWLGTRALELGLVDRLQTSDDYLMEARRDAQLVLLRYAGKKTLIERLTSLTGQRHDHGNAPPLLL